MSLDVNASLFEQLAAEPTLYRAWERVADNNGVAGIDGIEVEDFELKLSRNLHALHVALMRGAYAPDPLRRSFIPKANGDLRPLAIPTVRDRVAQTACALVLTPLLEPTFEPSSHGYRTGRSIYTAMVQIEALRDEGYTWVVDADIDDFFDEVRHERLLDNLRARFNEPRLLSLIQRWLSAPVMEGTRASTPQQGLPQGSPLAPLLANLYLDAFDDALVGKGYKFVRFADDFLILCKSRNRAEQALEVVDALLGELRLALEPAKSQVTSFEDGFKYLGTLYQGDLAIPPRARTEVEPTPLAQPIPLPEPPIGVSKYVPRHPLLRCLYVETQGASLQKDRGRFVVRKGKRIIFEIPCIKVEHVIIFGTAHVSTPAMKYCLSAGIPITFLSSRGQYYGRLEQPQFAQVSLHATQFERAGQADFVLSTAKAMLSAKLNNSRTLLLRARRQRRGKVTGAVLHALEELSRLSRRADKAADLPALLGLEGSAAKLYFHAFRSLLRDPLGFDGRNKRPPQDPVNSLLSFGYTLLFYNIYSLLRVHGLNPYVGNLHTLRDRSPSLASDLMEEFRAPVVDSLVMRALNRNILKEAHFIPPKHPSDGCYLTREGRRIFIAQFEKRLRTQVVHPPTGYQVDWRRCIQLQIGAYKRHLNDDTHPYEGMRLR